MLPNRIYRKLTFEANSIRYTYSKRKRRIYNNDYSVSEIKRLYPLLNSEQEYFHHYFWNIAPQWLRNHRLYFSKNQRAFGEDAFHAMWYLIFKTLKPKKVLEIGVYRGATLSLFSLLAQKLKIITEVHGISPFSPAGDSVSKYLENLDYYSDVVENFNYFNLPHPCLHKGYSTDKGMIDFIQSQKWDLIYIDGNHDYEIAKHDFSICSQQVENNGFIVLDDASLYTDYKPTFYSTAGHPGPSKVAMEINKELFQEILSVGHNRVFLKIATA